MQLGKRFRPVPSQTVPLQAVVSPVPRPANLVEQPGHVGRDHRLAGQTLQKLQPTLASDEQQAGAGRDILREQFRELPGLDQGGIGIIQPVPLGQ